MPPTRTRRVEIQIKIKIEPAPPSFGRREGVGIGHHREHLGAGRPSLRNESDVRELTLRERGSGRGARTRASSGAAAS